MLSLKATSILADLNQIRGSMERSLECHSRDAVRKAILKHEEIFREQVHELHRLYKDQKTLMAKLGIEENLNSSPTEAAKRIWTGASTSETSLSSSHVNNFHTSGAELNMEHSFFPQYPSNVHLKKFDYFDLEKPAEDYTTEVAIYDERFRSGGQLKEKQIPHFPLSWVDDGSEIELTLSTGCSSNNITNTFPASLYK
ncbi:hypothetical protein Cni_G28545 [Canna indica]|uniref:Uncharacterized protein n=1 Tax=Canna indica TaxID=4628 RepID=A0AAQ3L2W6_9LILI|nr:hypothetical protein Cni_G28545 [Canna indica]